MRRANYGSAWYAVRDAILDCASESAGGLAWLLTASPFEEALAVRAWEGVWRELSELEKEEAEALSASVRAASRYFAELQLFREEAPAEVEQDLQKLFDDLVAGNRIY